MFDIKFKTTPIKKLGKEIEKKILEVVDNLKKKFESQKRELNYKAKTEKDSLIFEIKSNDYTATEFLAQFDKQVREALGREFKTTIKDIEIITYEIEAELEEEPKKEFTIPFIKKIEFKGKTLKLFYEDISFTNIKDQYIEKSIRLVKDKIKMQRYTGKEEFKDIVCAGKERKVIYTGDPAVDLEEKNWIKRTGSKGQFVFGREFTALINVVKELLIENVYEPLGFYEMTFPKFESWEIPKKSGHAKNIYPFAYFVSIPKCLSRILAGSYGFVCHNW